jgi:hypothetical protein
MAAEARLPTGLAAAHDRVLARGMSSADGIEAVRRCLAGTAPHVLVSTSGWRRGEASQRSLGATDKHEGEPSANAGSDASAALPLNARPNLASPYVAPQDDVQRKICGVWREALGVEQVGVDDSFFELGGHSLLAIQVVARLNGDFGTAIPVAKLYEGLTPAFFADLVREARPSVAAGDPDDSGQRQERQKRQKQHQEKRRGARTGQGRLVQ